MTRPEVGTYDVEHAQIATVTFTSIPSGGGIELYVEMQDGSTYSFTAYTPAQIDRLMAQNGWLSFVDLDTLIVKEETLEAVMHALEQALLLGLEHFGIRVNAPHAADTPDGDDDPWAMI